jgi:hypothetical protein
MKTWITAFLFIIGFAALSQAKPYPQNIITYPCSEGIARESLGRGIESGVRGSMNRPQKVDESCFQQGYSQGQQIASSGISCVGEFWRAYGEGMKSSNIAGGSSCYESGYFSGLMNLHVEAREGSADSSCESEYHRGVDDQSAHRAMTGTASEPDHSCYLWGYTD